MTFANVLQTQCAMPRTRKQEIPQVDINPPADTPKKRGRKPKETSIVSETEEAVPANKLRKSSYSIKETINILKTYINKLNLIDNFYKSAQAKGSYLNVKITTGLCQKSCTYDVIDMKFIYITDEDNFPVMELAYRIGDKDGKPITLTTYYDNWPDMEITSEQIKLNTSTIWKIK